MFIRERQYSVEDLWALSHQPETAGQRLELSEGELIAMTPAGGKHGVITLNIGSAIRAFVREGRLGFVTAAETGYILARNPDGRDTVRAPDVGFIAAGRLSEGLPDGYVPFAPDLAVEVVSPGDDADDLQLKVTQYLRAGTKLVLLIYPRSQTVVAWTPDRTETLASGQAISGGDVLPGFSLPVEEVFVL
jgi:Uma2 family endonuclease